MMSFFVSWLHLILKLVLLTIYTGSLWIYSQQLNFKSHPLPIFLIAACPLFLTYEITTALGKGSLLNVLYTATSLLGCIIFLTFALRKKKLPKNIFYDYKTLFEKHRVFIGLVTSIFIFFVVRGLYLEYPGDAIDYLQRVGQANQDLSMSISSLWSYSSVNNFAFSLQHWLGGSDYLMRAKLRVVAALSICILSLSTYRLALWGNLSQYSSILSVLLFLGFYGNLQISFVLYKILQGATLAMVIYLEIIPILYRFISGNTIIQFFESNRILDLLIILAAVLICRDCHQEKLLYVFVIVLAYSFLSIVKRIAQKQPPSAITVIALLLTITPLIRFFFSDRLPIMGHLLLIQEWFAIGDNALFSYWPIAANSALILLDVIVIGLAIIILSSYRDNSKEFFMAAIAIAPFLLFINPIAVTALIKMTSSNHLYRIMTGGLPWIFLPLACCALKREKSINLSYLSIIFICLGLLAYAPIYGKFPHMLNRIPPHANGQDVMPIVEHLLHKNNQLEVASLNVMAPPYVSSYLGAWPDFSVPSGRWLSNDVETNGAELSYFYSPDITPTEITETLLDKDVDVIVVDHRDDLAYRSWLGRMTQHWAPDLIASQQKLFAGQSLRSYLESQPQPLFERTLEQNGFQVYQKIPHSL